MAANNSVSDVLQKFLINFSDDIRVVNLATKNASYSEIDSLDVSLGYSLGGVEFKEEDKNIYKNEYENLSLCAIPNEDRSGKETKETLLSQEQNLFSGTPLDSKKLSSLFMPAASEEIQNYIKSHTISLLCWDIKDTNSSKPYRFELSPEVLNSAAGQSPTNGVYFKLPVDTTIENRNLYQVIGNMKISITYSGGNTLTIENNLAIDISFETKYEEDIETILYFKRGDKTKEISLMDFKYKTQDQNNLLYGLEIKYEYKKSGLENDPFYMSSLNNVTNIKTYVLNQYKIPSETFNQKDDYPYKYSISYLGSVQNFQNEANLYDLLDNETKNNFININNELSTSIQNFNKESNLTNKEKLKKTVEENKKKKKDIEKQAKEKLVKAIIEKCNIYQLNVDKESLQLIQEDSSNAVWWITGGVILGLGLLAFLGVGVLAAGAVAATETAAATAATAEAAAATAAGVESAFVTAEVAAAEAAAGAAATRAALTAGAEAAVNAGIGARAVFTGRNFLPALAAGVRSKIGFLTTSASFLIYPYITNSEAEDFKLNYELALFDYNNLKEKIKDIISKTVLKFKANLDDLQTNVDYETLKQDITREELNTKSASDSSERIIFNFTFMGDIINALNSQGLKKDANRYYSTKPTDILQTLEYNPEPVLVLGNFNLETIANVDQNSNQVTNYKNTIINIADVPVLTTVLFKVLEEKIKRSSNFSLSRDEVIKALYEYVFQNVLAGDTNEGSKKLKSLYKSPSFSANIKTETFNLNSDSISDLESYFSSNIIRNNDDDNIVFADNYEKISNIFTKNDSNVSSVIPKTFKYLGLNGVDTLTGNANSPNFVRKLKETSDANNDSQQNIDKYIKINNNIVTPINSNSSSSINIKTGENTQDAESSESIKKYFTNIATFLKAYIDTYKTPILYPTNKSKIKRDNQYPITKYSFPIKKNTEVVFTAIADNQWITAMIASNSTIPATSLNSTEITFEGFMLPFISIGTIIFMSPSNITKFYNVNEISQIIDNNNNNKYNINPNQAKGVHKVGNYQVIEMTYEVTLPFSMSASKEAYNRQILEKETFKVKLNQRDFGYSP